ncbi:RNA demethylase ALKBH9B-like [Magnolia sinica]|uniref:RNA demethylase ALKBH9B-like n=1 Tax=Magnolia sinica TaxID=86752 RepID=UPI00265B29E1|nr:RNA demethylase ALKBH9B-like [Magnolia sinica]
MCGKTLMNGRKEEMGKKEIAAILLSDWMPFLCEGMCGRCSDSLQTRLQNLASSGKINELELSNDNAESSADFCSVDSDWSSSDKRSISSTNGYKVNSQGSSTRTPNSESSTRWRHTRNFSPAASSQYSVSEQYLGDDFSEGSSADSQLAHHSEVQNGSSLTREEREQIRFSQVRRKKDFIFIERINGKPVNTLQGLELHTCVFSEVEQKKIVNYVYNLQQMGREGQLRARTYSEPRKWMRGKGRVTIQFGCCYNYAVDKNGNPPGIIRDEDVDPIPSLFKMIIKRLVRWHVLPPMCVPNSCIVNIYDEGDCIPPHIDHHDFVRPFCTVSFLTQCNILFGSNLKIAGPGEFSGPVSIPLPVGSVLILNGNGADVAKHCVPAVPGKRISITFRKMDDCKLPYRFRPDPELQGLWPLLPTTINKSLNQQVARIPPPQYHSNQWPSNDTSISLGQDDFPPLRALSIGGKRRVKQDQS